VNDRLTLTLGDTLAEWLSLLSLYRSCKRAAACFAAKAKSPAARRAPGLSKRDKPPLQSAGWGGSCLSMNCDVFIASPRRLVESWVGRELEMVGR
jgi:hypothetical protein